MPALRLFGRRWLLAADDIPLPAAVCCLFHFVWCILLVVWFISVHGPRECADAWRYDVAVGGLLAAFVVSGVLEGLLVAHGLRGGPFETRKRRLVPRLIYLDFASHICQVAFNGYCTYLIYHGEQPQCEQGGHMWDPFQAMQVLVWCTWALIASLLILLVLSYNLFPDYSDPKSWERRCNCLGTLLCCCHRQDSLYRSDNGKPQRLTSRLGNIFATLFSHIDMTPLDVVLAFSLAMMLQRMQRQQLRQQQQQQGGMAAGAAGAAAAATAAAAGAAAGSAAGAGAGVAGTAASGWHSPPPGSSIELSRPGSPARTGSFASTDGLLLGKRLVPDLEKGLLQGGGGGGGGGDSTRKRQPMRTSSNPAWGSAPSFSPRAAAAEPSPAVGRHASGGSALQELHSHTHSFVPVRPVDGGLQVGAEKTEEGPEGQPLPGDSAAGEQGAVSAATLQEAAWAMQYAFASYGVLLFIFSKPTTGIMQLCCGRQCGLLVGAAHGQRRRRKLDLRITHNLNREATQQAAGLADRDLLDVRYEGEVRHVLPYFIGVDERKRCLMLAIRGSLSLDDCVRDLLFEPASLDEWMQAGRRWEDSPPDLAPADEHTRYAGHAGILEAARATFLDIQKHGVLHEALLAPGGRCHGYQLVVTGHSLGAGCAFLLALYLRQFCPELRCWAFSPPGGLASEELCAAAGDWCTSVACGKEWIPRLSVQTFRRMRDEMVFAALRCKQPKWVVLLGLLRGRRWQEEELFYRHDQLPAEPSEALDAYHASVERNAAARTFLELAGDFTPPGRCFHLKPTGVKTRSKGWRRTKQRQYRAVYIDGKAIIDEGILISGRMMADHMPDYALATLRGMARSLQHSKSTATVSDKAGERLADDMMGAHGDGSGAQGRHAGASSAANGNGDGGDGGNGMIEGNGSDGGGASDVYSNAIGAGSRPAPPAAAAATVAIVAPPVQQPALRRAPPPPAAAGSSRNGLDADAV